MLEEVKRLGLASGRNSGGERSRQGWIINPLLEDTDRRAADEGAWVEENDKGAKVFMTAWIAKDSSKHNNRAAERQ